MTAATAPSSAYLSLRDEAIVRIIHARGTATLGEVLTDYRARPMTAHSARSALDQLTSAGWLIRGGGPGLGRRAHWSAGRCAASHLASAARLPAVPGTVPVTSAQRAARYSNAPLARPTYRPSAAAPVREGAADFLRVPSKGAFV